MAIVWLCPLSVESYVAVGRHVVAPRLSCPLCSTPMVFWSGYWRSVRVAGLFWRVWIPRARCRVCRVSHGLIPSFLLAGRQDPGETIGDGLVEIAGGVSIGGVSRRLGLPFTTVRGWWRRFRARAPVWWSGFAALTVELGGMVPPRWPTGPPSAALAAMGWAHVAASVRQPTLMPGLWGFVSVVCGGTVLGTTTNPPWHVYPDRRFIAPSPMLGV